MSNKAAFHALGMEWIPQVGLIANPLIRRQAASNRGWIGNEDRI
jgi:hypothetical protein